MKFGFVAKHPGIWLIERLCEALGSRGVGSMSGAGRRFSQRPSRCGAQLRRALQLPPERSHVAAPNGSSMTCGSRVTEASERATDDGAGIARDPDFECPMAEGMP